AGRARRPGDLRRRLAAARRAAHRPHALHAGAVVAAARARARAGGLRGTPRRALPGALPAARPLADWRSWTDAGDAERITAGLNAIVVMPEGGNGGWYTDWLNGGAGGPPEWETFHID